MRAFRLGGPVELAQLLDYIPDSNGERQRLEGLMRKSRLSLAEAKEKYPDWYERRIVKKERRGRWTVKRDLYELVAAPDRGRDQSGPSLLWHYDAGDLCEEMRDR